MNQTTAKLYCLPDDAYGPYETSYECLTVDSLVELTELVRNNPQELANFYETAVYTRDVFCWLRYIHFAHSLLADGIWIDD